MISASSLMNSKTALMDITAANSSFERIAVSIKSRISKARFWPSTQSEAEWDRLMEKWNPTLVVDEADDHFKENPPLRAVVNSGWTRGAGVPRCDPDTNEPEIFSTFGPK